MLNDIENNNSNQITKDNKKTILIVTDNITQYKQEFNNSNMNKYKITFVKWIDFPFFITNSNNDNDDINHKNIELIILDVSAVATEDKKINQIPTNTIAEFKKIFSKNITFFIVSSESMMEQFVSRQICKKEDIRICLQPFSVIDLIDLISITKKKERLYQLQLKEHSMSTYSSTDDKIKDAIKFLKIGIENNETTLLLLSRDIEYSYMQSQMILHGLDMIKLQNEGLLNIGFAEEFYLTFDQKSNNNNKHNNNIVVIDNENISKKFFNFADQAVKNKGRKGLRVFAMMDCFFKYGLVDELVDYECLVPPIFRKPILSICAYDEKYIEQLSEDQIRRLVLTHSNVWI